MHCHTGCICLTFKHCVYSNVSKGEDNLGGPATSSIFQICSGYLQEVHWGRCSQRQRFSQFDKFDILIERNTKQCRENSIFVGYGGWDMLAYSISRKNIIFQSWSDANFLHLSCCKTVTSKSWFDDKLWISKDKLPFSFSNLRTHFIHFHQRVCLGLFQITIECFWTLKPKWIGSGWMDGWTSLNVTHLWQAWLWEAMLNEK